MRVSLLVSGIEWVDYPNPATIAIETALFTDDNYTGYIHLFRWVLHYTHVMHMAQCVSVARRDKWYFSEATLCNLESRRYTKTKTDTI